MSKLVSIYDPIADAYRQISLENAKKFVEECKNVSEQIENIEKGEK